MRYRAARMARYAFDDPMAGTRPVRSGGGWKALFWFAVAAAGVGFAGYVFLVPYQRIQGALQTRQTELGAQRSAADEATAERDKLKAEVAKFSAAEKDKSAAEARRKGEVEAIAAQLKPGLEELGATIVADPNNMGALQVTFPAAKVIDANGIDVSEGGLAAMKILAGAIKKGGARTRIRARASAAAPPRELKSLFHTAGEVQAVRAARVMSALEDAGLAPDRITIVGQADKTPAHARSKKEKAAPAADRLDIEVEPE
jgi:hypothetical protein